MEKYPWYESFEGGDIALSQGELIYNCPVLYPTSNTKGKRFMLRVNRKRVSGVIMTQSCDLAQGKADTILICPFSTLERFHEDTGLNWKKIKEKMTEINKGKRPRFFLLNRYDDNYHNIHEDYKIVDFQNVFTVPTEVAQKIIKEQTVRLRLLSPYREKLAYAYANYYSRIGLPVDISEDDLGRRCCQKA